MAHAETVGSGLTLTTNGTSVVYGGNTVSTATNENTNTALNKAVVDYAGGTSLRVEDTATRVRVYEDTSVWRNTEYSDSASATSYFNNSGFSTGTVAVSYSGTLSFSAGSSPVSAYSQLVSLSLVGTYLPGFSPVPGTQVVPGLPSLYVSMNGGNYQQLNVSNETYSDSTLFVTRSSLFVPLETGSASFQLLAVGGAGLKLDSIGLTTSLFETSGTSVVTSSRLISESIKAPVPEPETYAMFLAGLAALGVLRRRKLS
ncbi:PEP-CTERM sorting domain-containing protein [Ideonella margarita]|uniref:PEP-CTERM sorting domain-containing protein n=1 Tax=Ideonella margarita TaxID=2984191 RepID=A0ABU9C207_9BURK